MKKIAIVGSRRMSQYGREIISKLSIFNYQLNNKEIEIVTIKVSGCNNEIIIPEYDISAKIKEGENIIEFTPKKAGQFGYSCWMSMIRSSITVAE